MKKGSFDADPSVPGGTGSVPASPWVFDAAHSAVQFKVRHLMVSNVRGSFEKVSATVHYDEKDIAGSRAEVTIDANSINTRIKQRDDHLRSADFLDTAKYPTIAFKSKRVEKAGEGRLKVTGDLTIHGVTKEVALDVDGPTPAIKDMEGNVRVGGQATATISRKDFGLTWNKALETGGVVVGDQVEITVDLEIHRKPDAQA